MSDSEDDVDKWIELINDLDIEDLGDLAMVCWQII